MTKFVCLSAVLALVVAASWCCAEQPDPELARLRAEIVKLRQENATLKKQLEKFVPPQDDFKGVLRERSVTLQLPPQMSGIGPYRQETRLVIDLGNSVSYDLAFKGREEELKVRSWKGKKIVVRGSVQTIPGNPLAKEMLFPPPPSALPAPAKFSTFTVELNPPGRWVLVVESLQLIDGVK